MKLPKIIGHPGYQSNPVGDESIPNCGNWEDLMDKSLQMVHMTPLDTKITGDINIFEGRNAWGEFVEYLQANDIEPNSQSDGKLTIACNNITPLSETYSNEFGQSELFGAMQNITSGGLQEAAFITGWKDGSLENLSKKKGMIGSLAKGANSTIDWIGDTAGSLFGEKNGNSIKDMLKNPTQKIDIPSMWKGNSFSAQYELSIRLQCFNANDTKNYETKIVAPLGALMQFTCPRSKTGDFYQWPFLMEFEIPGLVDLPLAYASNLTVVKGGDINDLSWIWRPNVIDLRMTINTVWGVTVNTKESGGSGSKPTILKQMRTLQKKRGDTTESDTHSASRAVSESRRSRTDPIPGPEEAASAGVTT